MFVFNSSVPYLLFITLFSLFSVFLMYRRAKTKKGYVERSITILRQRYNDFLNNNEVESGFYLDRVHKFTIYYKLLHRFILIAIIVLGLTSFVLIHITSIKTIFVILLVIYFIFFPRTTILGQKTIYSYLLQFYEGILKRELDFELYRLILHLKNLAVTSEYKEYSSDYILNSLYESADKTKQVIAKVIRLWNLGKIDEAARFFSESVNTHIAQELALIVLKLDVLTTSELLVQIDLLLQIIRKERETNKIIANEHRSNLVYFIVIATSVVIMLNFVVIVYYLEAINNIQHYIN